MDDEPELFAACSPTTTPTPSRTAPASVRIQRRRIDYFGRQPVFGNYSPAGKFAGGFVGNDPGFP